METITVNSASEAYNLGYEDGFNTSRSGNVVTRYVAWHTCSIHETDHEYEDSVRCSECRMTFNRPWEPFKYCPNCGAKVVEE